MKEIGSKTPGRGMAGDYEITLSGTEEEINKIRAMLLGTVWITGWGEGKIKTVDKYDQVTHFDDPLIPPQWQSEFGSVPPKWAETLTDDDKTGWHSPNFYIKHLFGENKAYAKVQSWGFECMRSRRGEDGKFWEAWYLPGDWAAKGELAKYIATLGPKIEWHEKTRLICHWIAERVCFGSMEVAVQRMALANPD